MGISYSGAINCGVCNLFKHDLATLSHPLETPSLQNKSIEYQNCNAQSAGFEPARAEPNGFLVHRLNHSATTAAG